MKVGLELFLRYGGAAVDGVARGERRAGRLPRPQAPRHPQHRRRCCPVGGRPRADVPHGARLRRRRDGAGGGRRAARDPGRRRHRADVDVGRGPRRRRAARPGSRRRTPAWPRLRSGLVRGRIVCSPHEVAAVRAEVGPDVTLIIPGVRPAGGDLGDQSRVATPEQALADGADLLRDRPSHHRRPRPRRRSRRHRDFAAGSHPHPRLTHPPLHARHAVLTREVLRVGRPFSRVKCEKP